MAGHSRWAQVKHKKAGADAKRAAVFSKLNRMIAIAAAEGGQDPSTNPRLRALMEQVRDIGMPKENIERAIRRGLGHHEAGALHEMEYEAYGPAGLALLISGVSDNPNRTTAEVRRLLETHGGRLAEAGSVVWMFERRLAYDVPASEHPEELELAFIEAGAEDTAISGGRISAVVAPERARAFEAALATQKVTLIGPTVIMVPKNPLGLNPADRRGVTALIETIADHPDITAVWTNVEGLRRKG